MEQLHGPLPALNSMETPSLPHAHSTVHSADHTSQRAAAARVWSQESKEKDMVPFLSLSFCFLPFSI